MLTPIEIEVCQHMGISPEEFEKAKSPGDRRASNSENGDPLTLAEMQVCERLGLNELEFMEAKTSDGLSDPVSKAMIDALMPEERAICRQMGISEQDYLEAKPVGERNRATVTALNQNGLSSCQSFVFNVEDSVMMLRCAPGVACNCDLGECKEPPTELMLVPPGVVITGRDGRSWNNANPQGIVDYFVKRGVDLPFDVEHASELKAPQGEPAPAAAWVKGLEVREGGAIYGRIEWTPKGRNMVLNREYRYYSPVFLYDKSNFILRGLASVGLTNQPNLFVPALNYEVFG